MRKTGLLFRSHRKLKLFCIPNTNTVRVSYKYCRRITTKIIMKRRKFIKDVSTTAVATAFIPEIIHSSDSSNLFSKTNNREHLKGFIVSDAHFGWMHQIQPEPSYQQEMMKRIMSRFPDLNVFFDTGDAHHNDHHDNENPYLARENWCDIIQGGCGQVPFYYVIGNHEIRSNEDYDPEIRGAVMGSASFRPYYSFDLMGIHFISFPELIRATYITEEEFEWLSLDLEINKDKTVILLSHNNIIGTTSGNEAGYRGLVDSEKMLEIFRRNPNVIAWMHGHNHNYEIALKQNMLFVSNGRIGGFDPSRGEHGLGGIYFEIGREGLKVWCYSAEKKIFLDRLSDDLYGELLIPTSFDPNTPCSYSFGSGNAVNGQVIPVYNHHCGREQKREIFIKGTENNIINDDPFFTKYAERHAWHGLDKILIAGKVNHGNSVFEYADPGVRLKANTDWWTTLTLPGDNYDRYTYYRCPPDTEYSLKIVLSSFPQKAEGKQAMWLRLLIYNSEGRLLHIVQTRDIDLIAGRQIHEAVLKVPSLENFDTVYSDNDSDKLVNIAIEACFSGMEKGDVEISSIEFALADTADKTQAPGLVINGKEYIRNVTLSGDEILKIPVSDKVKNRDIFKILAGGSKKLGFLVRHSNLEWQVRNATVADHGSYLEIGTIRNRLSGKMEIIIVPLVSINEPYVHRIRKAEEIKVFPLSRSNKTLAVEIKKLYGEAQVEVYSTKKPKKITGAAGWKYEKNTILSTVNTVGKIKFYF